MFHFDLEKNKSTWNLVAKGSDWDLGQKLNNRQATHQTENFEIFKNWILINLWSLFFYT